MSPGLGDPEVSMQRAILRYPDDRLRLKAKPVDAVTNDICQLIEEMSEAMYVARGIGLAAPQIGVGLRIFVTHCPSDEFRVLINPEIVSGLGRNAGPEGCLSFPGVTRTVERYRRVVVRATDIDGSGFELCASGILSVAIQHEYDHLNGVLMVDRLRRWY